MPVAQCCVRCVLACNLILFVAGCGAAAKLSVIEGTGPNPVLPPPNGSLIPLVQSNSNVAERGMENEVDRACIIEIDPKTGQSRVYASGLRNPVGLAWEPQTRMLWVAVNERRRCDGTSRGRRDREGWLIARGGRCWQRRVAVVSVTNDDEIARVAQAGVSRSELSTEPTTDF